MTLPDLSQIPHCRWNPLSREWILVSPHRTQRPWLGKVEKTAALADCKYDPDCYLCPGNSRAGGARNPAYASTFVFQNDYAALLPDVPDVRVNDSDLLVAQSEPGICRVICFSPRHDLTIPRMTLPEIRQVVDLWVSQFAELAAMPAVNHVQIFENRGALMGASNPHPHCQLWANACLPNQVEKELKAQQEYRSTHHSCLLCDYLKLEMTRNQRVVCRNDDFVAVVPYWAIWPFETLLLSTRHAGSLDELSTTERDSLADLLKRLTTRYDNLFETSFPYSMGFHQRPVDSSAHPEWHFHAHYYPPLLRSATVQKFMVGYELLGTPQRDITPESAAERLGSLSETHYLERS